MIAVGIGSFQPFRLLSKLILVATCRHVIYREINKQKGTIPFSEECSLCLHYWYENNFVENILIVRLFVSYRHKLEIQMIRYFWKCQRTKKDINVLVSINLDIKFWLVSTSISGVLDVNVVVHSPKMVHVSIQNKSGGCRWFMTTVDGDPVRTSINNSGLI